MKPVNALALPTISPMPRSAPSSSSRAASRNSESRIGRPPKEGELAEKQKQVLFEPAEWAEVESALRAATKAPKFQASTEMRRLLLEWARGELVNREALEATLQAGFEAKMARLGTDAFRAPVLSSVPCGPWAEALEGAPTHAVSLDDARELEALPGDVWVRARGDSMLGAGIADGVLVLVRPYGQKPPRRGDIVVVQITGEDGEVLGTMKRFAGQTADGTITLLDGNDQPFPLPPGTQKVEFIAREQGVLGRV